MIYKIIAYLLAACLSTSALACRMEPKFARPYSLNPPLFGAGGMEYIFYTNPMMQIQFFTDNGKTSSFFTSHFDYEPILCDPVTGGPKSGFLNVYPGYYPRDLNWGNIQALYFRKIGEIFEVEVVDWRNNDVFSVQVDHLPIGGAWLRIALNDNGVRVLNDGTARLIPRASIDGLPALPGGTLRISVVPEPVSWLTMVAGFGLAGGLLRWRQRPAVSAPAA